jgi:hypothetical protein
MAAPGVAVHPTKRITGQDFNPVELGNNDRVPCHTIPQIALSDDLAKGFREKQIV